jgi:hypothetical protein
MNLKLCNLLISLQPFKTPRFGTESLVGGVINCAILILRKHIKYRTTSLCGANDLSGLGLMCFLLKLVPSYKNTPLKLDFKRGIFYLSVREDPRLCRRDESNFAVCSSNFHLIFIQKSFVLYYTNISLNPLGGWL